MAMQSDISSTYLNASGAVTSQRARLRAVSYKGTGTAGYLKLRDGGVSGTVLLQLDVSTADTQTISLLLPDQGILFGTSIYAEFSNIASATSMWS